MLTIMGKWKLKLLVKIKVRIKKFKKESKKNIKQRKRPSSVALLRTELAISA